MNVSNMKNIVILKNLPSNLIEEAIVVVKDKKQVISTETNSERKNEIQGYMTTDDFKKIEKIKQDSRDYVVKEAESVISNYLERVADREKRGKKKKIEERYYKLKYINIALILISILSTIICIVKWIKNNINEYRLLNKIVIYIFIYTQFH